MKTVVLASILQGMHKSQRGVTLLEILTAMAIVSILVMIAIPMYQDYRTRVKVGAEFPIMDPVKKRMTEEFIVTGAWPENNAKAMLGASNTFHGDYLQSVEVSVNPKPGSLILTYDDSKLPALGGDNTIIFYPEVSSSGNIAWLCDLGTMAKDFRPHNCR